MNIVFDFGAVLFAWQPVQLVAHHFPERAATLAEAQQLAQAIFHHTDWQGFDMGTVALDEVVDRTAMRLNMQADKLHSVLAPIGEQLAPIACNVALLAQLRERRSRHGDLKLYFLSNMPEPFARALERRFDFLQWFDGGIFSSDVKLGKPDPGIYHLLASRYRFDAARTLFVDDSRANVDAADALGWQTIHCDDPEQLPDKFLNKFDLQRLMGKR